MGPQVRVPGFTQVRIQEQSIVKWKQVYLERYTFLDQNKVHLRSWQQPQGAGVVVSSFFFFFFFFIFFICSGFGHTLKWISHGFTCVPHPDPPSHLPLHPIPLGLPSAPGPSTCLICLQPGLVICFTPDNVHVSMLFSWNIPPSPSPTESKRLFYTSVSLFLFCI